MQAFHNDTKVKQKYLDRVVAHRVADEIVKGKYWSDGKGCAVGCTIHSREHKRYETELGIPTWLARVEDSIFEGLPNDKAKNWPEEFLSAIKPGQDLEKIKAPFLVFVLESCLDKFDHNRYPKVKDSVDKSITLWKRSDVGSKEWTAAAYAAADTADTAIAAAYAADTAIAATYAAADTAIAAAYAAYVAAAYAAYAAAYAAAAAAACAYAAAAAAASAAAAAAAACAYAADTAAAAYVKFADKLLEFIRTQGE